MSYTSHTSKPDNSSNANFRDWGKKLSDAIVAVGFARTSDTGQINWATVAAPGAGSTYMGYELYSWADPTGGNPVTMKVEFGSGAAAVWPGIRITWGNGSDGAGNVTGNTWQSPVLGTRGNSATDRTCAVAGDGGSYLTFALWIDAVANNDYLVSVGAARTADVNGAPTSEGLDIVAEYFPANTNKNRRHTYLPKNGSGLAKAAQNFHCAAPPEGTGTYGTTLGEFPIFCSRGAADYPPMHALLVFPADHGGNANAGGIIVANLYGVDRSFLFPGDPNTNGTVSINGNTNKSTLALRYE